MKNNKKTDSILNKKAVSLIGSSRAEFNEKEKRVNNISLKTPEDVRVQNYIKNLKRLNYSSFTKLNNTYNLD